jgi:predicted DCC family thiol-disulfide oxidoreductase YuxK
MPNKIKVYLDGACHLCSWEAKLLRRIDVHHRLDLINIADPMFDDSEVKHRNYDLFMQAQLPNGEFVQGVKAFSEIYKAVPKMRILGQALDLPVFKQLAWIVYFGFAMIRKRLPKRESCDI